MLDHQHRVAEVAHALQGFDQPFVVALVEADRRLVEHVEHPHQLRADLGGEADALAFAAGEGGGRTVEREVADADVFEEAEAVAHLLHHLGDDRLLAAAEREAAHQLEQLGDRHHVHLVDGEAAHLHRQGFGPQAAAFARRAGVVRHVFFDLAAHALRVGFLVAPLEPRDQALELALPGVARTFAFELEADLLVAAAVEQDVAHLYRQLVPRGWPG